jgi:hypothetical protein
MRCGGVSRLLTLELGPNLKLPTGEPGAQGISVPQPRALPGRVEMVAAAVLPAPFRWRRAGLRTSARRIAMAAQ